MKGEEIPNYLKKDWRKSRRRRRVETYLLGNEIREGKYWEEEERRRCRLCSGEETWEHVWERLGLEGGRRKMAGCSRMGAGRRGGK